MRTIVIILLTLCSALRPCLAQGVINTSSTKDESTINSLVQSKLDAWVKSVAFLLSSEKEKRGNHKSKTLEEVEALRNYVTQKTECLKTFETFMCYKKTDDEYAKYMTWQRRKILPNITLTLTNERTGKTTTVKESIRNFDDYLGKVKFDVERIDITNLTVYLVDDIVKKKSSDDLGKFEYLEEHIYAVANYQNIQGDFKKVNQQFDNILVKRAKSYWNVIYDDEKVLKAEGINVIFGDAEINVYYK